MTRLAVGRAGLTAFYDQRYSGNYMATHALLEVRRVRETLAAVPHEPETILDYGCGRGAWMPVLDETFPGAHLVGVDISERAVGRAREDFPTAAYAVVKDDICPLPDGSVDLLFSYHVLEHVRDLDATVADMARLVRPGGTLCIMLPCANEGSFEEKIVRRLAGGVETSMYGERRFFFDDAGHLRRPTSDELLLLFADHGVVPAGAFFAGHFFGAIEWLAVAGRESIRELFDARRAPEPRTRLRLTAWRSAVSLLSIAVRVDAARIELRTARREARPRRRVALATAWALRPPAAAVAGALRAAAWSEWRRRRRDSRGSGMYLILTRT
jgi:SAM-dependent methyltransferase